MHCISEGTFSYSSHVKIVKRFLEEDLLLTTVLIFDQRCSVWINILALLGRLAIVEPGLKLARLN